MFTNEAEFFGKLTVFVEREIPALFDRAMRLMSSVAGNTIVTMTPRRTGYTQASWDIQVNSTTDYLPPVGAESYDPGTGVKLASALADLKFGDSIVIYSNAAWIIKLNEGSSELAPAHFVESGLEAARAAVMRAK